MEKKLYKTKEFAKMLSVSVGTLRNWHKSGILIPIILPGKHRRYSDEHFKKIQNLKDEKKKKL